MLQPKSVEVQTSFEPDGTYGIRSAWITKRPFFTEWSDRAIYQMHEAFKPEQLGYRLVDRMRTAYYARPWLIWIVLRARVKARDGLWNVMQRMYHRGWLHLSSPSGVMFRWRDVRLGKS